MRSVLSTALLFVSSALTVSALPGGAPRCAINAEAIAKGHGSPSDATAGFGLEMSMEGEDTHVIKVTNSAGKQTFKGILMYVADAADEKKHLGSFEMDTTNFKYQTAEICNAAQIQQSEQATITHSNPSDKPLTTEFKWKFAPEDKDKNAFLMAVIAGGGPNPWQALEKMPFTVGSAAAAPEGNMNMENQQPTAQPTAGCNCQQQPPRRVLKCKPKQRGGMMGGGEQKPPKNEGGMMGGGEQKPPKHEGGMMGGGEQKPPMGGQHEGGMGMGGGEQKPPMHQKKPEKMQQHPSKGGYYRRF